MNPQLISGGAQAAAFVAELTYAGSASVVTTLEFSNRSRTKSRLSQGSEVNTAPYGESFWMFSLTLNRRIKFRADVTRKDDYLLQANFVHGLHPVRNLRIGANIIMRMNIYDGVACLFDARLGNVENGLRPVVFEKDLLWRSLGWSHHYDKGE